MARQNSLAASGEFGSSYVNQWVVGVRADVDAYQLARRVGPIESVSDFSQAMQGSQIWKFAQSSGGTEGQSVTPAQMIQKFEELKSQGLITYYFSGNNNLERETHAFVPNDALFNRQWFLQNKGQTGGKAGIDLNLAPVWQQGLTGNGVIVGVIDDGLQWLHPDINANAWQNPGDPIDGIDNDANGFIDDFVGWNFRNNTNNPAPITTDDGHGTAVGGIIGARGGNSVGVTGGAPNAKLLGLSLIGGGVTDPLADFKSLTYQVDDYVDIFNNSWGFVNTSKNMVFDPLSTLAMRYGSENGRDGKGTIYVFSAGNSRAEGALTTYSSLTNNPYSIAVAALDHNGVVTSYSNAGASVFITGPSSETAADGMVTTDLTADWGYNDGSEGVGPDYTTSFNGTSASGPAVSGAIALLLEANPELTYRDVQEIIAQSARRTDVGNATWKQNGGGFWVSEDYGFGLMDTAKAVELAKGWKNLSPQVAFNGKLETIVNGVVPDGFSFLTRSSIIDRNVRMEWTSVSVDITTAFRGDLLIELTSPSGTTVTLAAPRGDANPNYSYTFWTPFFRGESSAGEWKLTVRDMLTGDIATLNRFQISVLGTDPSIPFGQQPLPTVPPVTGTFLPGSSGLLVDRNSSSNSASLVSVGTGVGLQGTVRVMNSLTGFISFEVAPYGPNFGGGVNAVQTDLTGDGVMDLVTVPASGGGALIKVYDGFTGAEVASFFAFDPSFQGGASIAAGDIDGDGRNDIIVAAGAGGAPHVRVFSGAGLQPIANFFAYDPSFRGGSSVAAGDINGDGRADIIVGAGMGGGPHVYVFDGLTQAPIASFFAYDPAFRGGVNVSAGDFNGDGLVEVITAPAFAGGPHIKIFDITAGNALIGSFMADDPNLNQTGGRVSVKDVTGDGRDDIVYANGPGVRSRVRVFNGTDLALLNEYQPFGDDTGGVFVG
ncbi:S8 family serine peptidase [Tuwongella immobilis]|nr:S8 family serine peptidase [Tuwongella immobilis]